MTPEDESLSTGDDRAHHDPEPGDADPRDANRGIDEDDAGGEPDAATIDDTGFDDHSFDDDVIPDSSSLQRFRKTTSVGMVMNAAALGLQEIFDPTIKQDAPVVQDAPGEPPGGRFIDADIDPYDPAASSVSITPGREGEEQEWHDLHNARNDDAR